MKKLVTVTLTCLAMLALVFSGCSKKSSGDPAQEMMSHMKAIFKILKDNSGDCDKAQKEVVAYTTKNKTELESLKTRLEEMEKSLSAEEKKKMEDKMKKQAEEMLQESMAAMMEFGQKCPEQMGKISQAMKDFGPQ